MDQTIASDGNIKICPNGHYYDASLPSCPICAEEEAGAIPTHLESGGYDAPQAAGPSPVSGTIVNESPATQPAASPAFTGTIIGGTATEGMLTEQEAPKVRKKLIGWIVSFEMDDLGIDFRITEGKNRIGRSPDNDIVINDPSVSGHHALILYRRGRCYLSDLSSTNGTFVNGDEVFPDQAVQIKDGAEIVFGEGKAKFYFRTANPKTDLS